MAAMLAFKTREAMELADMSVHRWNHLLDRHQYLAAPKLSPTRERWFDRDDIVALLVLDHFIAKMGVSHALAARVATAVRGELRRSDDLDFLWVVTTEHGTMRRVTPKQPPPGTFSHVIDVRCLRSEVIKRVGEKYCGEP
jgi:hypothetical protein